MQLVTAEYRIVSPSTRPMRAAHEPQSPSAQTTFVPVKLRRLRRKSDRLRNTSAPLTRAGRPLMYIRMWSRIGGPPLEDGAASYCNPPHGGRRKIYVVGEQRADRVVGSIAERSARFDLDKRRR